MIDVGERERLERENARLEDEREKLRTLITHLPIAAVAFDVPEFRIELANDAYEAIVGRRGMVGKTLDEIHPGVSTHSIRGYLTDVCRHKAPRERREHSLKIPRADGVVEERFFSNTFQPLFDSKGNVRSVVATVMEVTQEVRARQAEEAATLRVRAILDELPLGVIVRDGTTGEVLLTNQASTVILGLDPMADGGTDSVAVERPGGAPVEDERPHRVVMHTGKPVKNQILSVRRADEEVLVRTSAAPIEGYRKQPLVVSVFEDVTEEQRLLVEREQAVRFAETFVAVLGHDLRNPLNSITLGAQVLERRGTLSGADARTVRQMATSARRMARMVEQLLDMTRSRLGGGISIHRATTDLTAVVVGAIEELAIANPTVELRRVLPASLVGAWDGDRLAQVVSNLVGNAIEHGDLTRPITVTLDQGEGEGATLSVHNYGRAIPEALAHSLFDPFRRGEREASPRSRGLGLGLFITREIVVAHGGDVKVSSSPEEGTRFVISLPVLPSAPDATEAQTSGGSSSRS